MMEEGEDAFYYLTAMNENYAQPSMPQGAEAGILKGMYRLSGPEAGSAAVRLLGSGAILPEVIAAAALLAQDFGVAAEVFSVTSFSELARDAREAERQAMLNPEAEAPVSHVAALLPGTAPIVAASDYVRAYPQLIASYVGARFVALGTDGFGRSEHPQRAPPILRGRPSSTSSSPPCTPWPRPARCRVRRWRTRCAATASRRTRPRPGRSEAGRPAEGAARPTPFSERPTYGHPTA